MIDKPEVSVIVPVFNCEKTILNTLISIFNQNLQNLEILVIDNNSNDNTVHKIRTINDKRLKLLFCKKVGPAAARNYGIKRAKADIIAFLDADDLWDENKLEESLSMLKKYDFVYHDLLLFKKNVHGLVPKGTLKSRELERPIKKDLLKNGNGIITSSVVVRKYLIEKAGFFDENINLFAAEDYDLWIRISEKTENFKRINKPLGKYLLTGNNITNSKRKYIYTKEIIKKNRQYLYEEFKTDVLPLMSYNLLTSGYKSGIFTDYKKNLINILNSSIPFLRKIISVVVSLLIFIKTIKEKKYN